MAARAPGMQAATTLSQSERVFCFSMTPPRGFLPKGQSWFQNRTTTARMAPSWITTKNISLKASEASICKNSSTSSMCPVELTGSHSVTPSTMPRKMTFNSSMKDRTNAAPPFKSVFFYYNTVLELLQPRFLRHSKNRDLSGCCQHTEVQTNLPCLQGTTVRGTVVDFIDSAAALLTQVST